MNSFGQNSNQTIEIILNVYDLNPAASKNPVYKCLGIGFYHTGIEIGGQEYAYGGNDSHYGSGVYASTPLQAEGAIYKESYLIGIYKDAKKLYQVLDQVKSEFLAFEYNMITQNCNHFTEAFTMRLLNKKLPSYINRAARIGFYLSCLLPKSIKGLNPVPSEGGTGFMGANSASFNTVDTLDTSRAPFQGKSYSIKDYQDENE